MLRLSVTNVGGIRVLHRRSLEYPGFVLNAFLEPGEQALVACEPLVVKHDHTDGHRYDVYFYRLDVGNKYVYVCDFNAENPSQRSLICEGRYSDLSMTTIINVGHSPYAFRAAPNYPGTKLSGYLEKGESASVFSEFRVITHIHKDDHIYYIHSYKLADNSGWVPDFDPDHPDKRTMHDKCGFPLQEVRRIAAAVGLKEVSHNPGQHIVSFATQDRAKIIVYYGTGTVATSMHHPRQGKTQLFRRNQTLEGLRDIFLNPGVYTEIGYMEQGKKRGPNSPPARKNANVSPGAVVASKDDEIDEEEAIRRQIKRIDAESVHMGQERQRLTIALESYEKHRAAERRRENERENRLSQQRAALSTAEKNLARGVEMVCHTSNNAFIRKHWEAAVHCVALGTKCEFMMYDDGAMACSNPDTMPEAMLASLSDRSLHVANPPKYCALGSKGRYFLSFGTAGLEREYVGSDDFEAALKSIAAAESVRKKGATAPESGRVKRVSFGEHADSWIILLHDGTCIWNNVPARLQSFINRAPAVAAKASSTTSGVASPGLPPPPPVPQPPNGSASSGGHSIEEVSLGPGGEWFAIRFNEPRGDWESKSSKFLNAAKAIKTKITAVYFGSDSTYLIRHKIAGSGFILCQEFDYFCITDHIVSLTDTSKMEISARSDEVDNFYEVVGLESETFDNTMNSMSRSPKSPRRPGSAVGEAMSIISNSLSAPLRVPSMEPEANRDSDQANSRPTNFVNSFSRNTNTVDNRETLPAVDSVREYVPDRGFVFKLKGGHNGSIFALTIIHPSNSNIVPMVITGSEDRTAAAWNLHSGKRIRKFDGGHTKSITSIAAYVPHSRSSPTLIITAGKDSTAVIWDLLTGKQVRKLKNGHGVSEISSVIVYSPRQVSSPPLIVTGGWDSNAVVWDLITGQQMYKLEGGHTNGITCLSLYDPKDGSSPPLVITGSADDTVIIWNIFTAAQVRKLTGGHSDRIYSLVLHAPEDSICPPLIITGSEDTTAVVWDLHSGKKLFTLEGGHTARISAIAVSSSDDNSAPLVITASEDRTAVIWDLVTGLQIRKLTGYHNTPLHSLAVYSPKGGRGTPLFITGAQDKTAVIWDLWSSEQVRKLDGGHSKSIKAVAVYSPPDNSTTPVVVTGSYDKTAVVWDLQSAQQMHVLQGGHSGEITCLAIYASPDAAELPLVITGSEDTVAVVWDLFTGKQVRRLERGHTDWISSMVIYCPADKKGPPMLITGSYDKTIVIWDFLQGKLLRKLAAEHTATITTVAMYVPPLDSYATPLIITGSEDKNILIWDLATGNVVRKLEGGHTAGITSLVLHAKSETVTNIISVGYDKVVIIWDLLSGKVLRRLEGGHKEWISSAALYAPFDGATAPLLITGSQDKTVVVWDLNLGRVIHTLDGVHEKTISSLALYEPKDLHTPPLLITGSYDATAALWKNSLLPFEFMPLMDEVMRLFYADVLAFASATEPWSRIRAVHARYGDGFWFENCGLFRAAMTEVKDGATRDSFFRTFTSALTSVVHLVPLARQGDQYKCILQWAVECKLHIRHLIFDAWLRVLNGHDEDFLWQVFHPSMYLRRGALLVLSDIYPSEFIDFICKLRMVKSHPLLYRNCTSYTINNESGMIIEGMPAAITVDMWTLLAGYCNDINNTSAQPVTAYMLPMPAPADMKLLQAYVDVSTTNDDLAIFNSEVGGVAFRYAWRSFGKDAHINAMMYYGLFLSTYTCSVLAFDRLQQSNHAFGPPVAWTLQALVLRFAVKYIFDEIRQCYNDYSIRARRHNERMHSIAKVVDTEISAMAAGKFVPGMHRKRYFAKSQLIKDIKRSVRAWVVHTKKQVWYKILRIVANHLSDFWNQLDLAVILVVLTGTLTRICYGHETDRSRGMLALGCVLVWFKLLYFMRPFKGSGPLVTMILRIMSDIKYFLFILAVVLTGFALAFWMISYPDADLPFGTIPSSFINTFLYMLGQGITADFGHTSSPNLGVFLLVMFMLFMMILMLNLLIALMGNTFKIVQSKGLAQWRLEQASMMLEQRFTLSEREIQRHRHFCRVHVLKTSALVDKAKKRDDKTQGWGAKLNGETTLARIEALNKSNLSQMEAKLEALAAAQQKTVVAKLQCMQESSATQLQALTTNQTAADGRIRSLESKLDSALNRLSSKDNNNRFPLFNQFTTAATTAASAASTVATSAATAATSAASSASSSKLRSTSTD